MKPLPISISRISLSILRRIGLEFAPESSLIIRTRPIHTKNWRADTMKRNTRNNVKLMQIDDSSNMGNPLIALNRVWDEEVREDDDMNLLSRRTIPIIGKEILEEEKKVENTETVVSQAREIESWEGHFTIWKWQGKNGYLERKSADTLHMETNRFASSTQKMERDRATKTERERERNKIVFFLSLSALAFSLYVILRVQKLTRRGPEIEIGGKPRIENPRHWPGFFL